MIEFTAEEVAVIEQFRRIRSELTSDALLVYVAMPVSRAAAATVGDEAVIAAVRAGAEQGLRDVLRPELERDLQSGVDDR